MQMMMMMMMPISRVLSIWQMHYDMFNQAGLLRHIVDTIVVPNVRLREDDQYTFEENATEYIQKDMEVSIT